MKKKVGEKTVWEETVVAVVQEDIPEKRALAKWPKGERDVQSFQKRTPCRRDSQGKDPDVLGGGWDVLRA